MRTALFAILGGSTLLASLSCQPAAQHSKPGDAATFDPPAPSTSPSPASSLAPSAPSVPPSEWATPLKEAAAAYKNWTRVSDSANWSPARCIFVPPEGAQLSQAEVGAHARKLYFLYAKQAKEYLSITYPVGLAGDHNDQHPTNLQQPVGQVIVKEAFHPVAATVAEAKAAMTPTDIAERRYIPSTFCGVGDQLSRMGDLQGLYVMLKTPPGSAGTDDGWVYATITPAGEITAAGKITSCIECHADAPHDRLFGAQWHYAMKSPMPDTDTPLPERSNDHTVK